MLGPEVPARTTCGGGCILADMGLVPALNAQGRKYAFDVSVETDGVGRSTQDAEAAVYFWTGGLRPRHTPMGSGLRNMADRLAALGSRLDISSSPGAGTTVAGVLPFPGG